MTESSKSQRPDIFGYLDYRKFLNDWLAFLRAGQLALSVRALAAKARVSPAYLSLVTAGKRRLTDKGFNKIGPHLGLEPAELNYLKHLVQLGQGEHSRDRIEALRKMRRYSSYRKFNAREAEVHEYLTRWYYVAIRELVGLVDFKPDAEWMQSRLQVAVDLKEIQKAWDFLLKSGFVHEDAGAFRMREKQIDCEGTVLSSALAQFHHEMLTLAAESIENTPREKRKVMGHSFSLRKDQISEAQAIVQDAIERIRKLGESQTGGDEIYHAQIALFPLTRPNI